MDKVQIEKEVDFKAVRSSGAGGQNVNKVSTKVILTLNLKNSFAFSEIEKSRLLEKLALKLNADNELIVQSSETRSQLKNKEKAFKKLILLLEKSLEEPKKRVPTKTPKSVILKRLKTKKTKAIIKQSRQKPDF
uniref:alternative ribosome rescue aminoacyl-tRNA hydrolase ArfB n=1 Tax=Flavobacterium sp. TaxID=239 RepID=UPI00404A84BB